MRGERGRENLNGKANVTGAVIVPAPKPRELWPFRGLDSQSARPPGWSSGSCAGGSAAAGRLGTGRGGPTLARSARGSQGSTVLNLRPEAGKCRLKGRPAEPHLGCSPCISGQGVGRFLLSCEALGGRSLRAQKEPEGWDTKTDTSSFLPDAFL